MLRIFNHCRKLAFTPIRTNAVMFYFGGQHGNHEGEHGHDHHDHHEIDLEKIKFRDEKSGIVASM